MAIFNHKGPIVFFVLVNALLASQLYGQSPLLVIYPCLIVWSMLGPRQAIQALLLAWIFPQLSHVLFSIPYNSSVSGNSYYTLLRWMVLLAAFCTVSLRYLNLGRRLPRVVIWLILFVVVGAFCSVVGGGSKLVSLAKLISFFIGAFSIVMAFEQSADEHRDIGEDFNAVFKSISAWTFILLFMSESYRHADNLFRGVFYHPQVNGIFMALSCIWFLRRILLRVGNAYWNGIFFIVSVSALFESGSRTAALAIFTGFFGVILSSYLWRKMWRKQLGIYLRLSAGWLIVIATCTPFLAASTSLQNAVENFVIKRSAGFEYEPDIPSPRWRIWNNQIENVKERPFFGWGFGVTPNDGRYLVVVDKITGLPVSAPTEKSILFTGLLEEVGFVGFIAFMFLLFSLFNEVLLSSEILIVWLAISAFMVNVGEAVFFSFGGVGLFTWMIFGYCRQAVAAERLEKDIIQSVVK